MFWQVNPRDLQPGQLVDGWRIIRKIGGGGYGAVYEVEKDGQRFALKVACLAERRSDPKLTDARARREVACLQQLNHRCIIRLWAHGRWPDPRSGFVYVVLDLVDGYTLGEWVRQTFPTPHEVATVFMKLFDALEHMHERRVFHRDLSLRNIMVTRQGEPVIIDFGVADYATAEEVTDAPLPPGTPRNRSPEAMRFWRENRLNPKARYPFQAADDIFALGANLYDVLTHPAPEWAEKLYPLGGVVPPPSPFRVSGGRVPPELSAYAMKLIEPEPEERPATAKDARRPLEEFARYEGPEWRNTPVHPVASQLPREGAEGVPVAAAESAAPRESKRRAWLRPAGMGSLALLLLAAAMAFSLLPGHAPPEPLAAPPAEKPTSRPTQLALPVPTREEASSSVKQPGNSPTLTNGTPDPHPLQQARARRALSKVEKCALLVASVSWLGAGCAGVQKRPPPEDCPEKAVKAMRQELGWFIGPQTQPFVLLDVTKGTGEERGEDIYTVLEDGPVTGALIKPEGKAPAGTRLDGHLWTTGERIYGRYVRAHLPGGRTVPICVQIISGQSAGVEKEEGSKPGAVVGPRFANAMAVGRWD